MVAPTEAAINVPPSVLSPYSLALRSRECRRLKEIAPPAAAAVSIQLISAWSGEQRRMPRPIDPTSESAIAIGIFPALLICARRSTKPNHEHLIRRGASFTTTVPVPLDEVVLLGRSQRDPSGPGRCEQPRRGRIPQTDPRMRGKPRWEAVGVTIVGPPRDLLTFIRTLRQPKERLPADTLWAPRPRANIRQFQAKQRASSHL
jgi:hypothetical protein